MAATTSHILTDCRKSDYLDYLDKSLLTLSAGLVNEDNTRVQQALDNFGAANNWYFERLVTQEKTYSLLASLVERVRQEYRLFSWTLNRDKPEESKGYFNEITLSAETGLPYVFNFIELGRLKKEASGLLAKCRDYKALTKSLREMLLEDDVEMDAVRGNAENLHKEAMRRNFLENLQKTEIIGWELGSSGLFSAEKILSFGNEDLWTVKGAKYIPAAGMFEVYVIDAWQDAKQDAETSHILEDKPSEGKISPQLRNALSFGAENACWYILRSIDEEFETLHPVHVSRALIGPLEGAYSTKDGPIARLGITGVLLAQDPNTQLLRFSRQYSCAPNHEIFKGKKRQIIHQEVWSDEIIVAPSKCAAEVSNSVLGTNVRVFDTGKVLR